MAVRPPPEQPVLAAVLAVRDEARVPVPVEPGVPAVVAAVVVVAVAEP